MPTLTYSHAYDAQDFDPPMPVADITLLSLVTGEPIANLVAVVDSGADATMLPLDALRSAEALYLRARRMLTVTGQGRPVDTFLISIRIGPHTVHGIRAVAMPPGSEAILGRDVLNELEITLNGPAQELWVA